MVGLGGAPPGGDAALGVASHRETVRGVEESEGERIWKGHLSAEKAYAWSVPVEGAKRRRFYAVLHEGPVDSPEKAVQAAIVQAYKRASREE